MNDAASLWPAAAALIAAVLAVTRPDVVHGLMWLVAALLSLAAAFFGLGASFAGAVQILIYAGAILAAFVFVVMTVDSSPEALGRERKRLRQAWLPPAVMVLLVLAPMLAGLASTGAQDGAQVDIPAQKLGILLFGPWSIALEAASFLLLAALLGARCLGRRPLQGRSSEPK